MYERNAKKIEETLKLWLMCFENPKFQETTNFYRYKGARYGL